MKIINKYIFLSILLVSSSLVFAQQLPQFTQYMYNTISINPAYAGSRESLSIVGLHRSQWVGIEDAPTTQTLSIHAPLTNRQIGLGISIINDQLGFENFTYAYADFSYTIRTGEYTKLAFGIKGGFTQYSLDDELRNDPSVTNDPVVFGIEDRWGPNIGAGVYWSSDLWYIGISAPRLLKTDYSKDSEFEALERVSYYITGGYVFEISDMVKFKPATLVKATNGAPISFDLTANFLYDEKLWLGAGYRINEGSSALGGLVDFQVTKQFRVGYAYEYPFSDLNRYTGGTHEILLMFELINKKKRIKSPRYF